MDDNLQKPAISGDTPPQRPHSDGRGVGREPQTMIVLIREPLEGERPPYPTGQLHVACCPHDAEATERSYRQIAARRAEVGVRSDVLVIHGFFGTG